MAFQNVCNFASLFVSTEDRKLSVAIARRVWGAAVGRSSSMDILRQWMEGRGGCGIIYPQHCEGTDKKIPAGRKEDGSETICRADVLTVVPLIYLIIGYCGCCRIQGMLRRVADQCSKGVGVCERCPRHSKGLQIPDVTIPSRGKAALVTWAGLTHLRGLQKSWVLPLPQHPVPTDHHSA